MTNPKLTPAQTIYNNTNKNPMQNSYSSINVQDFGAKGDSSNDDTNAINLAINSSLDGDTIYFPAVNFWRNNRAVYRCTGDVRLRIKRAYIGGGGSLSSAPTILLDAPNANAVLGSVGWYGGSSVDSSDSPIYLFNLVIDGGGKAKYGLALMSYWSTIEQVQIQNTKQDGFYLTGQFLDSRYSYKNQSPENKFIRCRTEKTGGAGFRVFDPAGGNMTDVIFEDCVASASGSHGFYLDESAGSFLRGCHTYSCAANGFHILNAWATSITDCYVDGIGPDSGDTGHYYGIYAEFKGASDGTRGLLLMGNKIGDSGAPKYSTTGIRAIQTTGGNGYLTSVGNIINVHGAGANGNGLSYESANNGRTYVASTGNIVGGRYSPDTYKPHTFAAPGGKVILFAGC